MKKSRKRYLCLVWLCFLNFNDTSISQVLPSISISSPDWPPFYIESKEGDLSNKGYAWEVLNDCTSRLTLKPDFVQYPIRRMFREMEKGTLELNIMSYKSDREQSLIYGKEVVFTNTYGLWLSSQISKITNSLKDFDNLQIAELVGLRTSDEYRAYLDARIKNSRRGGVTVLSTAEAIAKMLASHRVDAAVLSNAEMRYRLKSLGLSKKVKFGNFTVKTQDYFLVLSKKSALLKSKPNLMKELDQCIKEFRQSGRLTQMEHKYEL